MGGVSGGGGGLRGAGEALSLKELLHKFTEMAPAFVNIGRSKHGIGVVGVQIGVFMQRMQLFSQGLASGSDASVCVCGASGAAWWSYPR